MSCILYMIFSHSLFEVEFEYTCLEVYSIRNGNYIQTCYTIPAGTEPYC
uniref:Uncharacterized protein n=1 Tax=Rhizophora mucronata TaxID=61149 RepID=A0A2P2N697_RHIMU